MIDERLLGVYRIKAFATLAALLVIGAPVTSAAAVARQDTAKAVILEQMWRESNHLLTSTALYDLDVATPRGMS